MSERTLFDREVERRSNFTRSSRAAARSIVPSLNKIQSRILEWMDSDPSSEVSAEDVADHTGIRLDTVKPRMNELHERGKVSCLEQLGIAKSGRRVKVYVVAGFELGRPTQPYQRGQRAIAAREKIEALRQQIRDLGHDPCV